MHTDNWMSRSLSGLLEERQVVRLVAQTRELSKRLFYPGRTSFFFFLQRNLAKSQE
jgi:hypothetical protein